MSDKDHHLFRKQRCSDHEIKARLCYNVGIEMDNKIDFFVFIITRIGNIYEPNIYIYD